MRDNEVVRIARAFVQQTRLEEAINAVKPTLGPDVVSLRYDLGEDWSGDPAIFFKIVLSDGASQRDRLYDATYQIENAIMQRLEPLEEWGVLPYFSYRSQSEQAARQEEAWA
jgi:hypothetical protein